MKIKSIFSVIALCFAMFCSFNADAQNKNKTSKDNLIYNEVDSRASFTEGKQALGKYLSDNTNYPKEALTRKSSGIVQVRFIVEKNGDVSNVEVFKGVDPILDAEAVRIVSTMKGLWTPAKVKDMPVRSISYLSINLNPNQAK